MNSNNLRRSCAYWSICTVLLLGVIGGGACIAESNVDETAFEEEVVGTASDALLDINLGSAVGNAVGQANSCNATNVFTPSCAYSNAREVSFTWRAPYTGTFTFTTAGSNFDTILQVLDGNNGTSFGCNDDANGTLQSSITLNVTSNQLLTLMVDGYGSACGSVIMNISAPISTTGLGLWLRADQGIQLDPVDGKVAQWNDQSGNLRHGTMTSSPRRPEFMASGVNGKPIVRFNGSQSLYLNSPVQPTSFTAFVVGKNRKMTESFSMILGPGGNWANNQLRWENGSQVLFVGTGNNLPITVSTIGNTRVFHLLSARYNGATLNVYRDGNLVSNHSFSTSGPWTLSQVGAYYSSYFMEGDLAEVLVYEQALSDANRMSVESYLKGKYALP